MSFYINLENELENENEKNQSNIFLLIKRIDDLLNAQNVINHLSIIKYNTDNKLNQKPFVDDKEIKCDYKYLKAQFLIANPSTYQFIYFDSYGRKEKTVSIENKKDFKKILIKYFRNNRHSFKIGIKNKYHQHIPISTTLNTSILTYHKQRVSKKTNNENITNELDIKIEVYKWLLNKYPLFVTIPELTLGNRRVDFISLDNQNINTILVEIKSELDTFDRLLGQLETYSKIGNLIYLAIDKKKYDELIKKDIELPKHIGILVFNNTSKKKLIELKKPKIQNSKNNSIYSSFLSYEDILNGFSGFKFSSKFNKEQKEKYISQNVDKNIINRFSYDILLNRHIIESDLRKELFYKNDVIKAVSSAKTLKINRFNVTGKFCISLSSYLIYDKEDRNILFNHYNNKLDEFKKEFINIKNIEKYLKKDSDVFLILKKRLRENKIMIYLGNNELSIMESFLLNKDSLYNFLLKDLND